MTKIYLKKKQSNIEEDVKLSTSKNAVNVDGSEVGVDGKSLYEEKLEQIKCEPLNQDIAEVKLDELKKVIIQPLMRAFYSLLELLELKDL